MKTLVLYSSETGNTEKVARRIEETVRKLGYAVDRIKVTEKKTFDLLKYDLIFMGSAVHRWLPTAAMRESIGAMLRAYADSGEIVFSAPVRPGRYAVSFCTFTGTHVGADEAVPATKWMSAFLLHLGYTVLAEWHVPGEFVGRPEATAGSRLGDTSGRPNEHDLKTVEDGVGGVIRAVTQRNAIPS